MNELAIYHKPECEYAYALDENTLRIILRVAAGERLNRLELLHNTKYDFTKRTFSNELVFYASDELFDFYRVDIKLTDVRFAYIFKLYEADEENGGERIFYYSEAGLSQYYDFPLAYYTFFQFPFINRADVVKRIPWTDSAVFYQIFIDRFCHGDFSKDNSYITQEWNAVPVSDSYCGGDLLGIISKLDFLIETGVNALYLTPVFAAFSNHKYNIKSYTEVDPQFGTNADLKHLLDIAHQKGVRVMLDTVFNHCDMTHEYFVDVVKKGRKSEYYDWFIIDGDRPDYEKGNYAYFADCKYMPKWNTNNDKVRKFLIDIAVDYIRLGFDGLRLDVADEVSHTMWRKMRSAVKAENPDALLLGEVWHENTHYLRGDEFDGVMNYRVQKAFIDYFANCTISAKEVSGIFNRILMQNYEQANGMMLNFLDNHDTPRFLRFCGGDKSKVLSALTALMLFPGMPCVFYGTEFPLDGAGDPDCRRTFDWSFKTQDKEYFARYKKILALKKRRCVRVGKHKIDICGELLRFTLESDRECIVALFNNSGVPQRLETSGRVLYSHNCNKDYIDSNGAIVLSIRKNLEQ